jgi:Mg2+-importing ATPase
MSELGSGSGGLTEDQAERRLGEYGPTNHWHGTVRRCGDKVAARLVHPLILVLLFASALSAWTGQTASLAMAAFNRRKIACTEQSPMSGRIAPHSR